MTADVLVDTGAILALVNPRDPWHEACVDVLQKLHRLPLLTSEAVLTELFYMVGQNRLAVNAAWKFVESTSLVLGTIHSAELPQLHALMSRYADRPMDFADATLVHLAQRESITTIFTVDHDDFETYRINGLKRFRVLPERRRRS